MEEILNVIAEAVSQVRVKPALPIYKKQMGIFCKRSLCTRF